MSKSEKEVEEEVKEEVATKQENPVDRIEEARREADRLEAANKEMSVLLKKYESLAVEKTFAGSANAGQPNKPPSEEELSKERASKIRENMGYN